jgi:hypothetical protein
LSNFLVNSFIEFPAASFSPDDISNLYAWYDGSDISTITKDGSNRVSKWTNKETTTSRDLIQSTGGEQPLWLSANKNGLDVIDFDTVGKFMNTASALTSISQPLTVFSVALYPDAYDVPRTMYSRHDSVADSVRIMYGGNYDTDDSWRINAGSTIAVTDSSIGGAWHYATQIFNTSSSDLRVDGSSILTGDAGSNNYQGIGMAHNGNEDTASWGEPIGEWIMYNKLLDSDEINQVETYLSEKWDVT